ncbi:GTPase HflX [Jonesiaceae bacterium BS-20]|uniref:GTPase HflX n=1 Tax=Jonesiaceae bacterium BS-20 TaxID=3120821 RepID=A0AAU7DYU4_9MICO
MQNNPQSNDVPQDNEQEQRSAREIAEDVVARVLARSSSALDDGGTRHSLADGDQLELEERTALRRVSGLSTELEDVTEVENRQLRLENVVLVGLYTRGTTLEAELSLRELAALADTAGSNVLDGVLQRRSAPDPGTYLGSGKARELANIVAATGADTVVVDGELGASQRRGLEDIVKVKVIDRTALILDIFAQHAKSREGKAQVELAQLEYLLPRLRGWGESMSRQAGGQVGGAGAGMGSRGPGETKIELDRRRIRDRIAKLRKDIEQMAPSRDTKRNSRKRHAIPAVAIAGYTNAGKSSLLNSLTGAGVLVENALFATLDPTVRRTKTPDGRLYTLADTVGFVRSLPHQLVEAFRSTLEEVGDADLILHVVDASHPDPDGQIAAVREVLGEIDGVGDIPEIIVLNKADVALAESVERVQAHERNVFLVSAHTGQGIPELLEFVANSLPRPTVTIDVTVPYDRGDLVNRVHLEGEIDHLEHLEQGTRIQGRVDGELASDLSQVAVTSEPTSSTT